ncbi:MAG: metal ABC transporter permease [Parachlamydiaceae bacterium]|nr:metal ABC transporter permease [Parachlamydiaceae bacterium]
MESVWSYFTDPVLRAPTLGCMLMCLSAALIGVITYLRKESLLGESLSHASYPGVILGAIFATALTESGHESLWISCLSLFGAFIFALLGYYCIYILESRYKIRADSALCFILSIFFGLGILLASYVQFTYSALYKQSLSYLYGQAATMGDRHILLYGILSLFVVTMIFMFYKELKVLTFDREYAESIGIRVHLVDAAVLFFLSLSIVVGIRSVGVVLMSAMLIAPAAAARQYTSRLSYMLVLAAIFGIISGFLGNFLSVELMSYFHQNSPAERFSLPTGPMIVMVASCICIFALFFAPERGLFNRLARIAYFRSKCLRENLLKTMWRQSEGKGLTLGEIGHYQSMSRTYLFLLVSWLGYQGWVRRDGANYSLTVEGAHRAKHIVRLHRLWEVYLCDYLGVQAERVHKSAEEIEHILTPELEQQLTALLKDPKVDPHRQPIPPFEGGL